MEKLYQIDTGYACGGIIVENNVVVEAAPIFRWMIGKHLDQVARWKNTKSLIEVV